MPALEVFPRHPLITFAIADKVSTIYSRFGEQEFDADRAMMPFGYSSVNGSSKSLYSAMRQHAFLIPGRKGRVALGPEALIIAGLGNPSSEDYARALWNIFLTPPQFAELHTRFGDTATREDVEKALVAKGFKQASAEQAARIFVQNLEYVKAFDPKGLGQASARLERTNPPLREVVPDVIELSYRLGGTTRATVMVYGPVTKKMIGRLMSHLEIDQETFSEE